MAVKGISGMAVAALAIGGVLLYSGIRGKGVANAFRSILMGESPSLASSANPIAGSILNPSEISSGGTVSTSGISSSGSFSSNAVAMLKAMGAPVTNANVNSMIAWQQHEGANSYNNPLNTTLRTNGSVGTFNSVGVQEYQNIADGIAANVQTMISGYPAIVSDLRKGIGLSTGDPSVSSELLAWSGGGYSSV